MRTLLALLTAAFVLAGCGRNDESQIDTATPPADSATPDTTTEPMPMPPPAEDTYNTPPSETPQSDVPPPSEPSPTPTP